MKSSNPRLCELVRDWFKPSWVIEEWLLVCFHDYQHMAHCRIEATVGPVTCHIVTIWPGNKVRVEPRGGKFEWLDPSRPDLFDKIEEAVNSRVFQLAEFAVEHSRNYGPWRATRDNIKTVPGGCDRVKMNAL